jgi:hypothetical protein
MDAEHNEGGVWKWARFGPRVLGVVFDGWVGPALRRNLNRMLFVNRQQRFRSSLGKPYPF